MVGCFYMDDKLKINFGKNVEIQMLKKPSGVLLLDNKEVGHTIMCCHGGEHFLSVKGSGARRGYCTRCKKVTCGAERCNVCIPFEERLNLTDGTISPLKTKYSRELMQLQFMGLALI